MAFVFVLIDFDLYHIFLWIKRVEYAIHIDIWYSFLFTSPRSQPFRSSSFDLGPSLMDEVFKALGGSASSGPSSLDAPGSLPPLTPTQQSQALLEDNESHNVKNEIKEMTNKFSNKECSKKKQAMVCTIMYGICLYGKINPHTCWPIRCTLFQGKKM